MSRVVLFAEVPSFYATVERADDPALADRPVIVGGDPRKRGLVQSASPEALAVGVSLTMSVLEALQLCPQARTLRTDMVRYREVSRRLFSCLRRGFRRLEPFGLGAAYFDLTASNPLPEEVGATLVTLVADELGLPLRVGVGSGKFLARLAAEEAGEGTLRIPEGGEQAFLYPLSAGRLDGVGRKTAATLAELGARSIGEVAALGRDRLEEVLGTHGLRIHLLATGADDGPVRAAAHPLSLSREATMPEGSTDLSVLRDQLQNLAQQLETELRLEGLSAAKVTLKLRFADQVATTRSKTLPGPVAQAVEIHAIAARLLDRTQAESRPVRGLGIQLGRMAPAGEAGRQLDLFSPRR